MKKTIVTVGPVLVLLALVLFVVTGCAGRGEVFGWGQDYGRASGPVYVSPTVSPCGG